MEFDPSAIHHLQAYTKASDAMMQWLETAERDCPLFCVNSPLLRAALALGTRSTDDTRRWANLEPGSCTGELKAFC
jgi:hypothetical protein